MKVYQHPSGFLRAEFSREPDGSSDRLHVWENAGPMEDGDIHQHSYDFTSSLLCGVMQEELFTYREDPDGKWERWLVRCYYGDDGQYHVEDDPVKIRVTPVLLETLIHKTGDTYERPAADFHIVTALEVPLITRSTTGPLTKDRHYFLRKGWDGSGR